MKFTKIYDISKLIPSHSTLKCALIDARHPANIDLVEATGHHGSSSANLHEVEKNHSTSMGSGGSCISSKELQHPLFPLDIID